VTGCVAGFLLSDDERKEVIEITPPPPPQTRELSKEILCDILQPRAVELLQYIAQEVVNSGQQISSGVILTGGSSAIRGIVEVAEQVFDAPTRVGFPREDLMGGLVDSLQSPEWSVAVGLALTSMESRSGSHSGDDRSAGRKVADWFEKFRGKFT